MQRELWRTSDIVYRLYAATNMSSLTTSIGDDIDPLDAYMASLADEITQQAPDTTTTAAATTPFSPPSRSTSSQRQQHTPPSTIQLEIAEKVSASPFCDVLRDRPGHRTMGSGVAVSTGTGSSDQHNGAAPAATGEATEACLRLLVNHPAEFLR